MSPALVEIEALRCAAGVSQEELAALAGVSVGHYSKCLRGLKTPRPATIAALRVALQRRRVRQVDASQATIAYRLALALSAIVLGLDPARCQDQDPARRASFSREWMAASEARRLALYLLNAGCGFSQSAVARAAGMTKQAVSLACREIEDRRSDRAFDELADRLTAAITGEM